MNRSLFNNFKVKIGDIDGLSSLDPGEIKRYFIGLFKEEFLVAAGRNILEDFLLVSPIKNLLYLQIVKKRIVWILVTALALSVAALFVYNFYIIIALCSAASVLLVIYFAYVPVSLQIVLDGGIRITISIKKRILKKLKNLWKYYGSKGKFIHTMRKRLLSEKEKNCSEG